MKLRLDPFFARVFTVAVVMGLAAAVHGAPWSITSPFEGQSFEKGATITGDGEGPGGKWCRVSVYSGVDTIGGPSEQKVAFTLWEQADDFDPPGGGWTPGTFPFYDLWSIEANGAYAFRDKHKLSILP